MKNKVFEIIKIMRFPLIFLVVMAHLLPFNRIPVELSLSTNNIYIFLSELISHNFAKIAVRLFFIISGYFFYLKLEQFSSEKYQKQLSKKIYSLLIPYITWNSIAILAIITVNYLGAMFFSRPEEPIPTLYNIYWGYPINFSLWYIRDLMVIIIVSPILYYYIKYFKIIGLLILYISYVLFHESIVTGLSTTSLFFFSTGIFLAINKVDIIQQAQRFKTSIAIIASILLLVSTYYNSSSFHEYLFRLFILPGCITLFNIFYYLSFNQKIKNFLLALAPTSFFIYVTHQIFIINWIKGAMSKISFFSNGWGQIIGYFISPFICVSICIILFIGINKVMPKALDAITGKRSQKKPEATISKT